MSWAGPTTGWWSLLWSCGLTCLGNCHLGNFCGRACCRYRCWFNYWGYGLWGYRFDYWGYGHRRANRHANCRRGNLCGLACCCCCWGGGGHRRGNWVCRGSNARRRRGFIHRCSRRCWRAACECDCRRCVGWRLSTCVGNRKFRDDVLQAWWYNSRLHRQMNSVAPSACESSGQKTSIGALL